MLTGHLPELIGVLLLALIVFGPKRLPEIGSSLGHGIRDFKKSVSGEHDEPETTVLVPVEPVTPQL